MTYKPSADWNPAQARLREMLRKPDCFQDALNLCSQLHAIVHRGTVTGASQATLADLVVNGLTEGAFRRMPTVKDVTIAWNLWHITRIEDITMNLLVADGAQVLNEEWHKRLHTKVRDTGNAMTDDEILSFSGEVDKEALLNYRDAVGFRSREILGRLTPKDITRKFTASQKQGIMEAGGLTEHPDSIWLLDFWGRKDVAGILLMPLTRHQHGHLNDCLKLRKKCKNP